MTGENTINPNASVNDIPDDDLLRRAVTYARGRRKGVRWSAVGQAFGLGSTYSAQLCRRFGLDPEEIVPGNRS